MQFVRDRKLQLILRYIVAFHIYNLVERKLRLLQGTDIPVQKHHPFTHGGVWLRLAHATQTNFRARAANKQFWNG